MFHRLFRKINRGRAKRRIKEQDYYKALERYRKAHPESLEEDKKQIQHWIALEAHRRSQKQGNLLTHADIEHKRLTRALYELREAARAAFMSHPAATERDFRRCWPSIREEMLKQHALEKLAANPALSENMAQRAYADASQRLPGASLHLLKTE